jgi:cobalt/nickel transport system permease protein
MHIPDGFIPLDQAVIYWIIALVFVALALRWARKELSEEKVPIVAVLAAAIFAMQAFNLPVGMGTSGHLVGGALAAIILGSPFAAVFILTIVLIIQGVIFGDGGITTMGANIINMGVIGGFVGFYGFVGLKKLIKNPYVSAGIAAWFACFIPALAASFELWMAGTFPLVPGLIAMGTYHAAIGVIEAFITGIAVYLIWKARPDLDWTTGKTEIPTGEPGKVAAL